MTETGGTTSYSLTTKAEQDRLQAALEKHLNRSPEARLDVYERMRANLDRVIARNNDSMLALRDGRDYQISVAEQNAEADRAARIADLHAEEQQEIRDALDANAAKFMGKIEGATPSEKRSINAQAKDRAAIIEKGVRSKYDEKIKAIENEAKIQKTTSDGKEKYAQMIQSIGELEAVIKALPMEIRGKIGGYREILSKATDEGRTTVLVKRIEMADKALEKRTNTFYFKAGEQVHELITPKGAVYTMFSLSLKADPKNTIENLPTLGKRLTLPKGWKYRMRTLEKDLALSSTYDSNPPNTIVLDQFEDNYQYNSSAK